MGSYSRGLALAIVGASALLCVLSGAASGKPAPAVSNNTCPNGIGNVKTAANVAVSATNAGGTTTYKFSSLTNESPKGGVPGLMKYCVYTTPPPSTVTPAVPGWTAGQSSYGFSFVRPGGDKTNIPLDGKTTDIGSATWGSGVAPSNQTILVHINDPAVCNALYGGDPGTCLVKPAPPVVGPVCNDDAGAIVAGYNSIPSDVEHCSPASWAFEGHFANEFGDKVTLDTANGNKIQSMTVDFQSYGCSDSGRWDDPGTCKTTPGEWFTIPGGITASIYDPGNLATPIATATIPEGSLAIPFRPSAIPDAGNCPNGPAPGYPADARFKDPVSGQCNNSLSVPLTFTFAGETLPSIVVWTVKFNTTHGGYNPTGENTTCSQSNGNPGCGYDSLNVGTLSYPNAPYAGTDVNEDQVFTSTGNSLYQGPFAALHAETNPTDWIGYRPLAEIALGA